MELPATIFVAVATILAALITGGISFVNLIISKDQKVSEFRQIWIDEMRKDISDFIGFASKHSAYVEIRKEELDDEAKHGLTVIDIVNYMEKDANLLVSTYNRILLRLNTTDDIIIIDKLKEIEKCYSNIVNEMYDTRKIAILTSELRILSQSLLKKEWKRVKRGELSYIITKYSALAVLAVILATGLNYRNDLCTIFIKDNTTISEEKTPNKVNSADTKKSAVD